MNYWMFVARPDIYNLQLQVINRGTVEWGVNAHLNEIKGGDKAVLWQSGKYAGIYGLGRLADRPDKKNYVKIRFREPLAQPILRPRLEKHPLLKNLLVLKMAQGRNPRQVEEKEYAALKQLVDDEAGVNIFTQYSAAENQFTNGLISLLELSQYHGRPALKRFFSEFLPDIRLSGDVRRCYVLRGTPGTWDAQLCGPNFRIIIETKIKSGALGSEQVIRHLEKLDTCPEETRVLVLLTPDESNSAYIQKDFVEKFSGRNHHVRHLGWPRVRDFLEQFAEGRPSVYSELVKQYLLEIRSKIFDQDYAGVIQKMAFTPETGLTEENWFKYARGGHWDTEKKYNQLDSPGRLLLLYHHSQGIVARAEVQDIRPVQKVFGFRNIFVPGTLKHVKPVIPRARIEEVIGKDLGSRSPYFNVTRQQYQQLIGEA